MPQRTRRSGLDLLSLLAVVAGVLVVAGTLGSATRTMVIPRGVQALITRYVFRTMRALFRFRAGRRPTYAKRDRIMALYAPVSLLVLVLVWESSVMAGYTAIFWGIGIRPVADALSVSGSSLTTLGISRAEGVAAAVLMFSEAALGLLVLALLITFLPSLYGAFSRREVLVALLEVRANSPPSAVDMILRYGRIHGLERLSDQWPRWEHWFAELEETHTSFPTLAFFRSPQPEHSWVTAAGAIMDAAALRASTIDLPRDPEAELCIRAGYVALRRIASFFRIPFDPQPAPSDPISITEEEFDAAYGRMAQERIPLKEREQAWRDFAGWRVNYDRVLLGLAGLTMAPYAPWSSDRVGRFWKVRMTGGPPIPVEGRSLEVSPPPP